MVSWMAPRKTKSHVASVIIVTLSVAYHVV